MGYTVKSRVKGLIKGLHNSAYKPRSLYESGLFEWADTRWWACMQGGLLYGCKISAELFQNFHLNLSFLTITCYFVLITGDQWAFVWEEGVIFRFYSLVRS